MKFLDTILKFLVGDKSKKDIKEIQPIVDKIKKLEPKIASLSLDELREKSNTFRQAIKDAQKDIQAEIQSLQQQADTTTNIDEKETLYKQIDDLRDKSYAEEKKALDEILPEAFAVIKIGRASCRGRVYIYGCRRWSYNENVVNER